MAERVVGQIASLTIGVEQSQQQRCELMSVGNAPERDTRVLTVAKNGEAKCLATAVLHSDMGTARSHILYKLTEMSGVGIAVVPLYGKREMSTEMGQYAFHLSDNIKIEHKLNL